MASSAITYVRMASTPPTMVVPKKSGFEATNINLENARKPSLIRARLNDGAISAESSWSESLAIRVFHSVDRKLRCRTTSSISLKVKKEGVAQIIDVVLLFQGIL
jgi:hypothetical protein